MAIKPILTIKDHEDSLRETSAEIVDVNPEIQTLAMNLLDTLRAGDSLGRVGVGLAAPQVGQNVRLAVVEYGGEIDANGKIQNQLPTTILINPKITTTSKEKECLDEGCFSVPEVYGPVERPKKIKVACINLDGKKVVISASGYYARVIQHEMDHLDGILYTDRVEKGKLYRYVKNEKGEWAVEY